MPAAHSFDDATGCQLISAIKKIRRMTSADPIDHSGRRMKEFASPCREYLDKLQKAARTRLQV